MPTYDYKCNECGETQEEFVKLPSLCHQESPCPCGKMAERVMSIPQKPYFAPPGGAKWDSGMGL